MKKIITIITLLILFIAKASALMQIEVEILQEERKPYVLNGEYYEVEFDTNYDIKDNDLLFIMGFADMNYKKNNEDIIFISGLSNGNFFEYRINTNDLCNYNNEFEIKKFYFNDTFIKVDNSVIKIACFGQKYEKIKIRIDKDYFKPYDNVYSQELYNVTNETDIEKIVYILNSTDPSYYDKEKPVFELNKNIYTDISNPIQLDSIIKSVKAIDSYCGDLSDRIKVIDENYNPKLVGEYFVKLSVTDDFNNTATEEIRIHVVDFYPPVISGKNYYEVGIVKYITIDEIVEALEISDNSGIAPTIKITDGYTPNKNKVGEYKVLVHAIDGVYNESSYEITINVIDDMPPVITGNDMNIKMSENKSIDNLKQFTYSDNCTSNDKLNVSYDTNYNPLKKGEYFIICNVTDELGNKNSLSVKIHLIDDIRPSFVGNNKIVTKYLTNDELYKYFNMA